MKNIVPTLLLTVTLIFGFSQLALSNNSSQVTPNMEMLGDSTKWLAKSLSTSAFQINAAVKKQKSVFDQIDMASDKGLEMKITTDLQNLIVNKKADDYQIAFIEIDANGKTINHELKLKPRGKYRRRICDFPPLKLNFSREELIEQGLNPEFDKLKLVTHCTNDKVDGKDNVLREYLTYQLYNELTDKSFRTKLVKIKYVDLHNSSKPITRYGFLIEDKDEMAMRLNGAIQKIHGLDAKQISKTEYNLMAMFQYMIGNEDWDAKTVRNLKAVQVSTTDNDLERNILVPYDFDFSGIVNAPYAIPDMKLKHKTVQQRHFFGDFRNADEFVAMSNHFLSRKKELLKTVRGFKRLNADSKIEIENYLAEFFEILESEEDASDIFLQPNAFKGQELNAKSFVKKK